VSIKIYPRWCALSPIPRLNHGCVPVNYFVSSCQAGQKSNKLTASLSMGSSREGCRSSYSAYAMKGVVPMRRNPAWWGILGKSAGVTIIQAHPLEKLVQLFRFALIKFRRLKWRTSGCWSRLRPNVKEVTFLSNLRWFCQSEENTGTPGTHRKSCIFE